MEPAPDLDPDYRIIVPREPGQPPGTLNWENIMKLYRTGLWHLPPQSAIALGAPSPLTWRVRHAMFSEFFNVLQMHMENWRSSAELAITVDEQGEVRLFGARVLILDPTRDPIHDVVLHVHPDHSLALDFDSVE